MSKSKKAVAPKKTAVKKKSTEMEDAIKLAREQSIQRLAEQQAHIQEENKIKPNEQLLKHGIKVHLPGVYRNC